MATRFWEVGEGRTFVGRLAAGSDLVEEIERLCVARQINAAWVSAIGAVRHVTYAYFDQTDHRYIELESDTHHEITGFVGNISLRDGNAFLHAHATFGDERGETVGGHLLHGIEVFAAEVQIREMTNVELIRQLDEETGLALW